MHWLSLLYIWKSVSEKVVVHMASHICPIDKILADVMVLKTLTVAASFGRDKLSSWVLSYEIISAPLGHIYFNVGALDV